LAFFHNRIFRRVCKIIFNEQFLSKSKVLSGERGQPNLSYMLQYQYLTNPLTLAYARVSGFGFRILKSKKQRKEAV
jgi:hypothetical protein